MRNGGKSLPLQLAPAPESGSFSHRSPARGTRATCILVIYRKDGCPPEHPPPHMAVRGMSAGENAESDTQLSTVLRKHQPLFGVVDVGWSLSLDKAGWNSLSVVWDLLR